MRRHRGGSNKEQLKRWASKAVQLAKKYGPTIARKYKLGSRALGYAAQRYPKYASYINPVKNYVAQQGYGKGGALRAVGMGVRSVGGRKCRRRRCH